MTKTYDLVIVGTGTAASGAASQCHSAGSRVAVIDHLPFGGTCALRSCDPKKVLVGAAEAIDHARRMRSKGVEGGEPLIDWRELITFKRSFTEPVPVMKEKSFAKSGIDAYHGRARFTGPRAVEVGGKVDRGPVRPDRRRRGADAPGYPRRGTLGDEHRCWRLDHPRLKRGTRHCLDASYASYFYFCSDRCLPPPERQLAAPVACDGQRRSTARASISRSCR